MNKTYRTVWCESTRTFVAVAENVKARGKRSSGARLMARAALAVAVAGVMGVAQAVVTIGDTSNPGSWNGDEIVFSDGSGRIVFSQGGTVTGLNDAALDAGSTDAATGRQVHAVDQKVESALAAVASLDDSAVKFNAGKAEINAQGAKITNLQDGAVAAGSKEAVTGGQLHTVDQKAQTAQTAVNTLDASAVKFNAGKTAIDAGNAKITNLQNGAVAAGSKEAVTGGQLHVTNQSVDTVNQRLQNLGLAGATDEYTGIKYFRVKSAKDDALASGADAIAVGPEAQAAGNASIAMGDGAATQTTAEGAIAVGRNAAAAGARAVVLGDGASVESEFVEDAVAMGTGAKVSGDTSTNAVAVGTGAEASAAGATALGAGASASGTASVALGAAGAQGSNALALGNGAQAHAANDIALGTGAGVNTLGTAGNDRTSHIAIGTRAGQGVEGNQTIAMGFEAGSQVTGDQNIAIGSQAGSGVDGDLNVAIGYQANRNAGLADHATAVGANTYAGRDAVAMGYLSEARSEGSVALGTQARVTSGQGVAIGKNAVSDGAGVALGSNAAALASDASGVGYLTGSTFAGGSVVSVGNTSTGSQRRIVNVADGSATHDAVNVGQLKGAQQSVANLVGGGVAVDANGKFGTISLVDTNGDTHQYNTVVDALGAVTSGGISVLPPEAAKYNANGTLNVSAATQAAEAVNLQQLNETIDANAARYYSVNSSLPGNRANSNATGSNALAIGPEASATGDSSMAIGYQAFAQSGEALALGHNTNALGANSTVVGNHSFAYGKSGVAIGDTARSQGDNSIVIGTQAQADPKDPTQTVHNSVVIGTRAESTADNGVAVGENALASDVRGIAQGYHAEASARDATAIGSNALASGVNATASGTRAIASGNSAIASGTDARGYAASGIAMGQGAQAGKANPRPDEVANNVDAVAIGTGALAEAKNSSALGRSAHATAEQALAVGDGSVVSGRQGSALGAGNTVTAEKGLALGAVNTINGAGSSAAGNGNTVNGNNAQVVGNANQVAASNGGVFGNDNSLGAGATGSRVIGNGNTVGVPDAFVMGNGAGVTVAGGVALGTGSASTTGANVAGYVPNGNGGTANNAIAATRSTTGAVAVGGNGVRRQITGVAAGAADTDAVNVAQLKATGWNVRTDGDTATHVSTGQGNTVDIGLADSENNLTVTRTSSNGTTVIDYALNKNLDLGTTGSVKTGDTLVNNAGVAVGPDVALNNTGLVIANGPSVTTGGIDAGGKTITKVAAGVNATDAVNVSQLTSTEQALTDKGFALKAGDGQTVQKKLGEAVDVVGADSNVTTQVANGQVQIALGDSINVTNNLSVGGTTNLGNNTLVVKPGDVTVGGNTTVNMGGNKVTNIAKGEAGTDAVNVDQLNELAGKPLTFTADSGADLDRKLGDKVGINGADSNITTETTAGGVRIALAQNLDLGPAGSVKTGDTLVNNAGVAVGPDVALNNSGLVIANGPSVTRGGIDAGGKTITNVAAGVNATDAVNVSQLTSKEGELIDKGFGLKAGDGQTVQKKLGEAVDVVGADSNVTTQVANGQVQIALGDSINVANNLSVGGNTTLGGTLNVTGNTSLTGGASISNHLTVSPNTTVNMGGNQIHNVAAGTAATDAVNLGQLNDVANKPLTFTADSGAGLDRRLGEAVGINGADGNITTQTTAGGVQIALAKNLDLGPTGSIKTGDTLVSNAGITVGPNVTLGNTGLVINNGPSVTSGGIDAGGRTITNVAAGINGTDAVNVDQLKGVQNVANAGWNLTAEGGNLSNVAPGATVDLASSDGNIVITKGATDADVKFALADQVNVSNVSVSNNLSVGGTTNLGNNTLVVRQGDITVGGNTTVNMGGNKVTNIAKGEAGTDAVNVDQLTELANKPLTFTADAGPALERKLGDAVAINGADANLTTATTAGGVQIALARNLDLGPDGSIKMGDTMLAGDGLAIVGGPSVTRGGINAGGKSILNVAAGVNDTDAVNVSQLKDVETVARAGWQLSVNGNAAADQSQVKPGDVVDFSNDDGNVVIAKNGNDVKVNLNRDLDVDSVTAGDTVLDKDGVNVGNDVRLTASGLGVGPDVFVGSDGLRAGNVIISAGTGINAGGFKITNVAAGTDPTDAVNVSQLRDVEQNVSNLDDRAVKYDGKKGDPKNSITLEGDKSTDGGKTGGTKITNLAQGEISATSTDAVNGAQLHEQGTQVAGALGGNSKYVDGKLVTELNVGDKTYNNVNDALNGVNNDLTNKIDQVEQTANAGWQIEANGDGASKVAPGSKVEFANGDNVEITRETSADGNNTIKVSVSQDIKVNSVTANEVKTNTVKTKEVVVENGPTINQNGIDMNNRKIINLGAGTAPTDAVNVGQLEAATSGLQNQVNQVRGDLSRLSNKLSAGVASAMATAGLPQAYLPGKSMAAMAGGTYNGESGFALGVSTVSDNGSWVLKVSGNSNSRGDYGGAVGVGYQW